MKILFFDTETTGKPINYSAKVTDTENWPRIIQIGYIITDDEGVEITRFDSLVKPDGWEIPKEEFWIKHGYSTEKNELLGLPMTTILNLFIGAIHTFDIGLIVAHNVSFDMNVIGAEMVRYERKIGKPIYWACTMIEGTNVCKIPNKRGYKWPKLEELVRFLFDKELEGAHDALADVSACCECFFELVKRGNMKIPWK